MYRIAVANCDHQCEEWIKKLLNEGYTIIDMGNPLGKNLSFFYEMEKSLLGFK
ncbi:MAG: hypothetical protein IPL98_03760 [Saprospiraceae bacterium]|nr:hypothetical protein [Saprospiraceae bacterium]